MDAIEFNNKYEKYLEDGHYGMAIDDDEIINYMDKQFELMTTLDPMFTYSQIKLKFGMARVYTNNSDASDLWEKNIDDMLKNRKK